MEQDQDNHQRQNILHQIIGFVFVFSLLCIACLLMFYQYQKEHGDLFGTPEERIENANIKLKNNPKDVEALHKRGSAREELNDLDGAIMDYEATLEYSTGKNSIIPRKLCSLYSQRGNEKKNAGKLDEAISDLKKAQDLGYFTFHIAYQLGDFMMLDGDVDGAISAYSVGIEKLTKNHITRFVGITLPNQKWNLAPLYGSRGFCRFSQRDWDGALVDFEKGYQLDDKYFFYNDYLAITLMHVGRNDEAKRIIQESIDYNMQYPASGEWFLATDRYLLGEIDEEELFKRVSTDDSNIRRSSLLCESHFYIGNMYLIQGDETKAKEHFTKAMEIGTPERNEDELLVLREELKRMNGTGENN